MPRKSKSKSKIAEVETASIDEPATHASASADVNSSPPVPKPEKKTPPQQAGPYEDRRKEMQRRLQKLVQEMRDSGCTEPVIKSAIIREKRKEEKKIIALEEKRVNEEKACANDVIIVPVAWKRNQSEKISVDVSCDNVRRALFSAGLNPWLDCRREYSPGQKFAYWEHMRQISNRDRSRRYFARHLSRGQGGDSGRVPGAPAREAGDESPVHHPNASIYGSLQVPRNECGFDEF